MFLKMGFVARIFLTGLPGSGREVQPLPAGGPSERVPQDLSPVFNKIYYKILSGIVKKNSFRSKFESSDG